MDTPLIHTPTHTLALASSSVLSFWCMYTVMHVSRLVLCSGVSVASSVMLTISRSVASARRWALTSADRSRAAVLSASCTSAVQSSCKPSSATWAGTLRINSLRGRVWTLVAASRMTALIVDCMPSTRRDSHASTLPCKRCADGVQMVCRWCVEKLLNKREHIRWHADEMAQQRGKQNNPI